jgi:hypothetical protein
MLNNYDIEIEKKGNQYFLIFNGSPIRTASGKHDVCHSNQELLKHMVDEFLGFGSISVNKGNIIEPVVFSSYAIFSDQKLIFSDTDPYIDNIDELAFKEPCLQTCAGPEQVEQLAAYQPFWKFLMKLLGEQDFEVLKKASAGYYMEYFGNKETDPKKIQEFSKTRCVRKLRDFYESFSIDEKGATHGLFCMNDNRSFLLPMVLIKGGVSKNQYASAFTASEAMIHEVFGDIKRSEYVNYFESFKSDIDKALDYVKLSKNPIESIILGGETAKIEFKSTLRFNLYSGKNDDEITHSCLKTIAAFLNTGGGKLLIGVSDGGNIVGIKKDGFPNNDKYQLHLYNLIKEYLGNHVASLANAEMIEVNDNYICLVKCDKSPEPVYLNFRKKEEEYFIRTGPGTTKLSTSEAHKYIIEKFEI